MYVLAFLLVIATVAAFTPATHTMRKGSFLSMVKAPPGMKPMADGTFKKAGEHPKTYNLDNENKAQAIVDTETAACKSWINRDGIQVIDSLNLHCFPDANTPIKTHFIPEERAKKVSFDRMIFKATPDGMPDIEYRVDVTMREDSLEYDVILKNFGDSPVNCGAGVDIRISAAGQAAGYKVQKVSGYDGLDCKAPRVTLPVGKFVETAFYFLISK